MAPEAQAVTGLVGQAERSAERIEIPSDIQWHAIHAGGLVACAELRLERARAYFLKCEHREAFGAVRRDERFFADGSEVAEEILHADGAPNRCGRSLNQFGACLDPLDIEHRTDLFALEFGMGVIGIAGPNTQPFENPRSQFDFRQQIGTILAQIDRDTLFAFFLLRFFAFFLAMGMSRTRATWYAITRIVNASGKADHSARCYERHADIARCGFGKAVGQYVPLLCCRTQLFGFLELTFGLFLGSLGKQFLTQRRSNREPTDLDII